MDGDIMEIMLLNTPTSSLTLQAHNPLSCSVGSTTDEHGHTRPVAFMPYRVNGQYIMEVGPRLLFFGAKSL